jgi:potassium efflux system protein
VSWSKVQWLAAAITVGLGFGLQEIFANFVSGLILLTERPIRVGDTVTIGNIEGTISQIRIRATTIKAWDRRELVVPNREFITNKLVNWTLSDKILRVVTRVGVMYGTDTERVREKLLQIAEENPNVLEKPKPKALLIELGESSLIFELRTYVQGVKNFREVTHSLNSTIHKTFREAGIEIAFPQQDIHIRTSNQDLPITDKKSGE